MQSDLLSRIKRKKVSIAVVGLGYVGLPLALTFVKKGFFVLGIDLDRDRVRHIAQKHSFITDVTDADLKEAAGSGRFKAFSDFSGLKNCGVIIICVPTPLKRRYTPDISYIKHAVKQIARHINKGTLVILESTTYPGTTEEVIMPLFEQAGLKHGRDYYLCFSPERIDPGNKAFPVHKIPKVVGGINKEACALASALYRHAVVKVVPVSSARVAETVKLLENTFRLVNIGLINELAIMAHKMKVDIWEIIEAAKTKPFGFMPFYPGPGVGGHCIPKDPLYLYWRARHHGISLRFVRLASEVISRMPEYVVERIRHILSFRRMKGARILVVGVTYKKDTKDLRKSPALDIIAFLQKEKCRVSYHDPLIPYLRIGDIRLISKRLEAKTLKCFDCVVIATDHSGLDYGLILKNARLIFDLRNAYRGRKDPKVHKL